MKLKTRKRSYFLLVFVFILTLGSCRNKKDIQKETFKPKPKELVNYINSRQLDFDQLAAKLKVKANLNGNKKSFTSHLRWDETEKLWFSFSIFGIEGYRLLIEPTRFQMLDRLGKKYYDKSIQYLKEIAKLDVNFVDLEQLLKGGLY